MAPSWNQPGDDADVLQGGDRSGFVLCLSPSPPAPREEPGDAGAGALEPPHPGTAAQRAWAPLQRLQRCQPACSPGPDPARRSAPDEAPRDGPGAAFAGGVEGARILPGRVSPLRCHAAARDGPPSTPARTKGAASTIPWGFTREITSNIPPSCQARELPRGQGQSLQPGAARSLTKHTPSPAPYLENNEPVNLSLWDHHEDGICQSPARKAKNLSRICKRREGKRCWERSRGAFGDASARPCGRR